MNGFSIWLGAGAALGLWQIARSAPQKQVNAWVNLGIIVLAFALTGARLMYAGLHWSYFSAHLLEIALVSDGGLAWPGAVVGVALALLLLGLRYRAPDSTHIPLGWLGDRLYPMLPVIAITAWLGCWWVGSAYGPLAPEGAWWGVPVLDETGQYRQRLPLQALAAVSLIVYFAWLESRFKPLRPAGRISTLACIGLSAHLLAASLLRADPAPTWNGLRVDTWMVAGFLVAVLGGSVVFRSLALLQNIHHQPANHRMIDEGG